jgi:hypothetical protein
MTTAVPTSSTNSRSKTPDRCDVPTSPSLHINTPTKLHRYLEYAESTLGVNFALNYEHKLEHEGYGPDILETLPDEALTTSEIGLRRGDAIRLKRGCAEWWKLEAKRPRLDPKVPEVPDDEGLSLARSPNDTIQYQLKFPEGGCVRYWGPAMLEGGSALADTRTSYFNEALNAWFPVPPGYCAPAWSDEGRDVWS